MLEWGLVIATHNRSDVLHECLRLSLSQSRLPSEVIIVDSGSDFDRNKILLTEMQRHNPDLRVIHERAKRPSSSVQRAQGTELALADVLFLIDDDTLMYSDCAETVMAIYESDPDERVAGVGLEPVETPPTGAETETQFIGRVAKPRPRISGKIKSYIWRRLFLMSTEEIFLPYDGHYHRPGIPSALQDSTFELPLLSGFQMTMRRRVAQEIGYEPIFESYSAFEDLDLSYRASRHGALCLALGARGHHLEAPSGRLKRFQSTFLGATNQAYLVLKHMPDRALAMRRYRRHLRRRLAAEFLKELLSRRWSLPQFRGLLAARRVTGAMFAWDKETLERMYPAVQKDILANRAVRLDQARLSSSQD